MGNKNKATAAQRFDGGKGMNNFSKPAELVLDRLGIHPTPYQKSLMEEILEETYENGKRAENEAQYASANRKPETPPVPPLDCIDKGM